ncbi:NUMOD3 domain-containing DNA-binding protein, partial [Lactococcus petauri]|uniref:NUMOD3 domain-containing DNA-binding protein n=1 Tax=Lactococcus petauri TaxID=1940789 RepID=UPI0021F18C12
EGYNVAHLAGKTLGVRRPRTKPHPGHSLETRQLLSKALTGKSKSPLHNIRSGLGHRIPVIQLTLQGEFVKEWACSQEALFSLKYKSNKI